MTRSRRSSAAALVPLGLCLAFALVPSVACAENIPWSRNWSIRLNLGSVMSSGFAAGLKSTMRGQGWAETQPEWTDPFFGFTFPAEYYPKETGSGGSYSFQVAHSIMPTLAIGASWSGADLGGQTGYDGSTHIEITSSMSSLALLVLTGDKFRFGGGPSIDWLQAAHDGLSGQSTTGIGLTLQGALRVFRKGPFVAGLELQQHFGSAHEIGPYPGGTSTFPAVKVSSTNTTLGLVLGLDLASE